MSNTYKTISGIVMFIIAGFLCFVITKTYFPVFYHTTAKLILAGDMNGLSSYITSFGYWAFIISILIIAIFNVLGIPTIPSLTVNGVLFGIIPGIIISWIGEVIGIELSYHIGRIFLRKSSRQFIEKRNLLEKLDKYSTIKAMIIARAVPYSPNILTTAVAVVSKLNSREHLRCTLIGKIPSVVVEVLLGHDLLRFEEHSVRFFILLFLVIAFTVVHRYRKRFYQLPFLKKFYNNAEIKNRF